MRCDLHVHTAFSADCDTPIEGYCTRAIELGMSYLCFTDHMDTNPLDYGTGYYDPQAFFDAVAPLQKKYADKLTILAGVEFAEPHMHPEQLAEFQKYPYDMIIGSIHWVGDLFPTRMMREGIPHMAYTDGYWREIYCAARHGGVHTLGHMDFPKRYFGETPPDMDLLAEAMKLLLKNGSVIEINTSALRNNCREPMPGLTLLQLYKEVGGTHVTVGSDAHFVKDLSAHNEVAKDLMAKVGLKEAVFVKGKLVEV